MELDLQQLERREWWLWLSALGVSALSALAFALSSFPALFLHADHFFEIRSDQARWATLSLLLLFNGWLVYRQRSFRRLRLELTESSPGSSPNSRIDPKANREALYDASRMDQVTGLHTRASIDQWLGKEVARARRHNVPLSLVALHLDDLAELSERFGSAAGDLILKEFANRLKRASRGTDFGVRLGNDDFLLVLPDCSLKDAKIVSDRLGAFEMKCSGQDVELTCSVGWIDYKPGEVPSDLIKRAGDVLQLYKKASNETGSITFLTN